MSKISDILDLIAAKARLLKADYEGNKLWPGDAQKVQGELRALVERLSQELRDDR